MNIRGVDVDPGDFIAIHRYGRLVEVRWVFAHVEYGRLHGFRTDNSLPTDDPGSIYFSDIQDVRVSHPRGTVIGGPARAAKFKPGVSVESKDSRSGQPIRGVVVSNLQGWLVVETESKHIAVGDSWHWRLCG
jgi:hypothetical protein